MPPTTSIRRRPANLQYFLLALVIFGSMLFYLATGAALVDSLVHHADRARLPFVFDPSVGVAIRPLPEAIAAGIHPGDIVLSVDGVPFTGMAGLLAQTYQARAGQSLSVLYRTPDGHVRTAQVPLKPGRPGSPGILGWLFQIVRVLLFPAFCLLLGYWVVLAKPRDWNAWFFLGVMNVVPAFIGRPGYYPGFLAAFTIFWQIFAINAMLVSLILLGIYFPVRSRLDERYPWIKWLLLIPQILVVPAILLLHYGMLYHIGSVRTYLPAMDLLDLDGNVFAALAVVIFIAAIVRKLFTVPAPDARRRLGVVAAGSLLGLGPALIALVLSTLTGKPLNDLVPEWAILTLIFLFPLFPLSLAYTVIVQRALDVRIFLRQGTRYAFARGTFWVLQAIVFSYLGYWLVRFSREGNHHLIHIVAPIALIAGFLILRARVSRPLSLWLDRRFFREEYSAEQVLNELSEQARGFTETGPLMRTLIERIVETLHVESIAVLLRDGDEYRLKYSHGLTETGSISLPSTTSTIRTLVRSRTPARVNRENPDPWLSLANPAELLILDQLRAELLLPLPGRTNLIGIMALGPKRSEEPYSPTDRRLLQTVALQTGLAIENSELIHNLAHEAMLRERLNREIEIAQEVQERLFPQVYPVFEGVDLAGFCRTAQEIGGDYYDFIALENGRLGVAVGDVSGKGISAALLMASMRAALRGLTLSGTLDLAAILQRMNKISYDSSTSNRFATFFFAEYDRATRKLIYVNAGHNAPVLLRIARCAKEASSAPRQCCNVQRLEIGGPVMGVFPEVHYEQGELTLEPEDVLIAFTDGLSEAMTAGFEEWGEDRLIATAQSCASLSAKEIISCLVEAADRFTAGAAQQDDMTMVVVKVN